MRGSFRWTSPEFINELYFPLCNEAGIMSSVTPMLHGDMKSGQNSFFLLPVSIEDIHNSRASRNFWLYIHGKGPFSITCNSSLQASRKFTVEDTAQRTIEAGLLWHKLTYRDEHFGISSKVISFVPVDDKIEIMIVGIENISSEDIKVTPTSVMPIYGRSAENIRDHRHVTSLVNRIEKLEYGMALKPEIIFDEKAHRFNKTIYYTLGFDEKGLGPMGSIATTEAFIGSQGSFDWPKAIVENLSIDSFASESIDGKECAGTLRFNDILLKPGKSKDYIVISGMCDDMDVINSVIKKYNSPELVYDALDKNKSYWIEKAQKISFQSGLKEFSNWMKWVSVQPTLRKIYGCSFLPHHDYGKGGRGWRDLWQDCLSLIIQNPNEVRNLLINNYAGIRIDGTNATIIGSNEGEFIADRNNISRVWMDHGAWPFLTTKLYIDQSGDLEILLKVQSYFKDMQIERAYGKDESWNIDKGNRLKTSREDIYEGAIIEHLLVQHLTSFFNVGEHNIIKLEGADWNDTLDMASQRGESVAFTALYGSNLLSLSELLTILKDQNKIGDLELFEELSLLIDSVSGKPCYDSVLYKKTTLDAYLNMVSLNISGRKNKIKIEELIKDLKNKGEWILYHIRDNEWIRTSSGDGFFNGYYNNDGERVDGEYDDGIRMNLTAQVFTTMYGIATDGQVQKSYESCRKYLKNPETGGYRLNTPLGPNKLNFGRGFAFAYGEKENGATFSHMVIMYIYALYKRRFVKEAYEVFKSIYDLSLDKEKSKIYPGITEYFNGKGKGMYHYLTGSASWLILTVLNEMYGVRGEMGDLVLEPKLTPEQFDKQGIASVYSTFDGIDFRVDYMNDKKIEYEDYKIIYARIDEKELEKYIENDKLIIIPKADFKNLLSKHNHLIKVYLSL